MSQLQCFSKPLMSFSDVLLVLSGALNCVLLKYIAFREDRCPPPPVVQILPCPGEVRTERPWLVYFWCLVSSKQSHICNWLRALSMCRGAGQSQWHHATVSSDTQPRRNYCHHGRGMPWLSSFQGCDCSTVLQVLQL